MDRLLMGLDICIASNDRCELLGVLREARAQRRISPEAFATVRGGSAVRMLEP